jgi:phenylalanyl-tRNA synthetase beta chain
MRVSLSWLAEFVRLDGGPEELCQRLSFAGLEAEIAEDTRPRWPGVVTAQLKEVKTHPNADRLTVTRPWDGSSERQVVCGARNHREGDIVALATPGTTLPGDVKITKSKIRGEMSEGMLCSERELGLSEESEGILILPPGTPLGVPLHEVLRRGDVVLELSPTANRGDCLSILGVAREVAAVTGWPLLERARAPWGEGTGEETVRVAARASAELGVVGVGERQISVRIDAPDGCPRYAAAVMTGAEARPSPAWMRERLEAAGLRSLGAIVDSTNYVMLELGNPLHAFDLWTIRGRRLEIRRAMEGEALRTLDGKEHGLRGADLVIADAEGAVALAGVMGGASSEVGAETTDLLLESAHFAPETVRATTRRHRIPSEASHRFARGVDPGLPQVALLRLVELLSETAGARLAGGVLDLVARPPSRPELELRLAELESCLGVQIPRERAAAHLRACGCHVEVRDGSLGVRPPTARFDLEREIDLIEEVARLHGYDHLPERSPERPLQATPRRAAGPDWFQLRRDLVGVGLSEVVHLAFEDDRALAALGIPDEDPLRSRAATLGNPLSEVGSSLRTLLLPALLRSVERNRNAGNVNLRLFELRPVFRLAANGIRSPERSADHTPLDERLHLGAVLTGRRNPPGWSQGGEGVDFYDLRALVDTVLRALGGKAGRWEVKALPPDAAMPWLDPNEAAILQGPGRAEPLGWMGRIAVPALRAFGVDAPVYAVELDLGELAPKRPSTPKHRPFSRFPGAERDLALVVPDAVSAAAILDLASRVGRKALGDAFQGVMVFDVFRGGHLPAGTRSLALRFTFRALDRTLSEAEIDAAMTQLLGKLTERDGVEIRR